MAVRRVHRVHPQGIQNGTALTPNVVEVKITQTVSLVFLAFSVCWIPVGVIDFTDVARGFPSHPRQVYVFETFVIFLSSTINPLIYGLTSRKFRREYKKLLCCKWNELSTDNECACSKTKLPPRHQHTAHTHTNKQTNSLSSRFSVSPIEAIDMQLHAW